MMTSAMTADRLLSLFKEQRAGLEKLYNLLVEEHRVIQTREIDQLQQIAQIKQQMVKELEPSEIAIQQELRGRSIPLNNEGIHTLINSFSAESAELNLQWEELADIAGKCQDQNQINGRIIMASQASIQQAHGILTGSLNSSVYNRRGKTETAKTGNISAYTKI